MARFGRGGNDRRKREIIRLLPTLGTSEREILKALEAIDGYLKNVDPEDVDLLLLKGYWVCIGGRSKEAVKLYERVLRIEPDNPQAWIDLGDFYVEADSRRALKCYGKAMGILESGRFHFDEEDEFVHACAGKAEALLGLGRPHEALRCIVHGLQKCPEDNLLARLLGKAQEQHEEWRFGKGFVKKKKALRAELQRVSSAKTPSEGKGGLRGSS